MTGIDAVEVADNADRLSDLAHLLYLAVVGLGRHVKGVEIDAADLAGMELGARMVRDQARVVAAAAQEVPTD